ncbi:MAG: HlyD family efflux transporter periplasmic adaptor subunit [Vicinamibacterales bacterium]
MRVQFRRAAFAIALVVLMASSTLAQSIRDRIRLSKDKITPITDAQANELTLTLNDAAVRPIQVWIRTAATIDRAGRALTALLSKEEAASVKVGQRVRAFPPQSRSSMFQAKIVKVAAAGDGASVTALLSGPGHDGSARYVLEIVTEPLEALSIPNEAIIEVDGKHVVYVQAEKGRYLPREIQPGLQGELYTHVVAGLKAGEQVVTFGSFFIDADFKLKGS